MSSSSILATKTMLVSCSLILIAMTMKLTIIPWLINFSASEVPIIWSLLVSLCKPPYLYVVINGIIITIAASSRFTRTETETMSSSSGQFQPLVSGRTPPLIEIHHDMFVAPTHVVEEEVMVHHVESLMVEKVEVVAEEVLHPKDEEVVKERMEVVEQHVVLPPVREMPPPLSRFAPPKPSKPRLQGKKKVTIEKSSKKIEEVTLESMWKTIMEGREEPSEQLMKKSNVNEDYTQKVEDESTCKATPFNGGASYLSESPVKSWILKKEPTLSQEELNRRADEFIHKFNEEMRMQRQQSLIQNTNARLAP